MDLFKEKYVACQRMNFRGWKCSRNFDTWGLADRYSEENHKKGVTTLLPIKNIWPNFIKKMILAQKLTPRVDLEDD
jgi:hypothetical protein